jgi:hypothetical protein
MWRFQKKEQIIDINIAKKLIEVLNNQDNYNLVNKADL